MQVAYIIARIQKKYEPPTFRIKMIHKGDRLDVPGVEINFKGGFAT